MSEKVQVYKKQLESIYDPNRHSYDMALVTQIWERSLPNTKLREKIKPYEGDPNSQAVEMQKAEEKAFWAALVEVTSVDFAKIFFSTIAFSFGSVLNQVEIFQSINDAYTEKAIRSVSRNGNRPNG